MAAILPYLQDDAFQPDDVKAMSMALDDVCKELKLDGNANAKKTIAVRIIELARCGERSPSCWILIPSTRPSMSGAGNKEVLSEDIEFCANRVGLKRVVQ